MNLNGSYEEMLLNWTLVVSTILFMFLLDGGINGQSLVQVISRFVLFRVRS
jgi:hypothetical protein